MRLYWVPPQELQQISLIDVSSCVNVVYLLSQLLIIVTADDLWKGVTTVSNAGKKRGRGRTISKKNIKDLNKGQVIGVGMLHFVLNSFG